MSPELRSLISSTFAISGLEFSGTEGVSNSGRWLELWPADHHSASTFTVRTAIGWRRIEVQFRPGGLSSDLLKAMGEADANGRLAFRTVLAACRDAGGSVTLTLNGARRDPDDDTLWNVPWASFTLDIQRGMLAVNEGNVVEDRRHIEQWTGRMVAAVLAIVPLERETADDDEPAPEVAGLPEGDKVRVEVNRYERDRRNRAAALVIHGYACKACDTELESIYGRAAAGLIEIHHVTPVSELGAGYIINPRIDLVPLCPNCHSVAHRRTPPYTVEEIRDLLSR